MCSNHPKFDKDLLPAEYEIRFRRYNTDGHRKIVIAEVVKFHGTYSVLLASGHAICSPLDTYDIQRGEAIATGRAVKQWWKDHRQPYIAEQVQVAVDTFMEATSGS